MAIAHRPRTNDGVSPQRCEVDILGWGYARLPSQSIPALRRSLPSWAPPNTANHFFRYADDQTLLAVQAVGDLLRRCDLEPAELSMWGIIAAPQFLGRQVAAHAMDQFFHAGGQRISPHIVPQNSLHSVSCALSILLATHGPNVGMGGGCDALTDGLLAALTLFDMQASAGCWLVATAWDPEPLPNRQGSSSSPAIGHAVALAMRPQSSVNSCGQLSLSRQLQIFSAESAPATSVAEIVADLQTLDANNGSQSFAWRLPWGATLNLELTDRAAWARQAA